MRIGLVGLGFMGSRIAELLLQGDHELLVYDRRSSAIDDLVASGAHGAGSAAEVANVSELIITCLPGPAEVQEVLLAPQSGVLANAASGTTIVDHTTNAHRLAVEVARRCDERGIRFIDAPVTGRPPKLTIFAGSDHELPAPLVEVFGGYSAKVVHTGPNGTGSAMKLANQLLLYSNFLTVCEALVLGANGGVDASVMVENFRGGGMMLDAFKERLLNRSFSDSDGAPMSLIAKDMGLIADLAEEVGIKSALIDRLNAVYQAGVDRGWTEDHFAHVLEIVEEQGSIRVDGSTVGS